MSHNRITVTFPFAIEQVGPQAVALVLDPNHKGKILPPPEVQLHNAEELRMEWGLSETDIERLHARVFDYAWIELIRQSIQIINPTD